MELSEIETNLIAGLKLCPLTKGERALIFIMMETDEQKIEMLRYILSNEQATSEELLDKAYEIAGREETEEGENETAL